MWMPIASGVEGKREKETELRSADCDRQSPAMSFRTLMFTETTTRSGRERERRREPRLRATAAAAPTRSVPPPALAVHAPEVDAQLHAATYFPRREASRAPPLQAIYRGRGEQNGVELLSRRALLCLSDQPPIRPFVRLAARRLNASIDSLSLSSSLVSACDAPKLADDAHPSRKTREG